MRTLLGALGVAVAVFFAGPASADDAPNPELLKKQLLEKFDANGDGNLTGQELLNAREAAMKQIGAAAGAAGINLDEIKKNFDRDGDGQLNPQEQAAAMAAFQKARANGGLPAAGGVPGKNSSIPAGGGFGAD